MCAALYTLIRVNLLKALGGEVGYLGEWIFARLFPGAARGEAVALLVEGLYSSEVLKPRGVALPKEDVPGVVSRHVAVEWPIHKSWFVPAVDHGTPRVFIDPPKRLVKYVGRDVEGEYANLLAVGLWELRSYVLDGVAPALLEGWQWLSPQEVEAAEVLYRRLVGGPDFVAAVVETLREVDFLLVEGGGVYHVEVKTTTSPTEAKLRKKRALLARRQRVLEKLGLRPALAVVVPRENWEVEVWVEKVRTF